MSPFPTPELSGFLYPSNPIAEAQVSSDSLPTIPITLTVRQSTIPPLPSAFAKPSLPSQSPGPTATLLSPELEKLVDKNSNVAMATLIMILLIFLILLYLAAFIMIFIGRIRGHCPGCARLESKIKKMQGEPVDAVTQQPNPIADAGAGADIHTNGNPFPSPSPRTSGISGETIHIYPGAEVDTTTTRLPPRRTPPPSPGEIPPLPHFSTPPPPSRSPANAAFGEHHSHLPPALRAGDGYDAYRHGSGSLPPEPYVRDV